MSLLSFHIWTRLSPGRRHDSLPTRGQSEPISSQKYGVKSVPSVTTVWIWRDNWCNTAKCNVTKDYHMHALSSQRHPQNCDDFHWFTVLSYWLDLVQVACLDFPGEALLGWLGYEMDDYRLYFACLFAACSIVSLTVSLSVWLFVCFLFISCFQMLSRLVFRLISG